MSQVFSPGAEAQHTGGRAEKGSQKQRAKGEGSRGRDQEEAGSTQGNAENESRDVIAAIAEAELV